MAEQKIKSVRCESQKQATANLVPKSVRTRSISEDDVEEYRLARHMEEQLDRIREFLVEHGADEDMLAAIDQAMADNEQWIDDRLDVEGSA